jgi:hypothetical protein
MGHYKFNCQMEYKDLNCSITFIGASRTFQIEFYKEDMIIKINENNLTLNQIKNIILDIEDNFI